MSPDRALATDAGTETAGILATRLAVVRYVSLLAVLSLAGGGAGSWPDADPVPQALLVLSVFAAAAGAIIRRPFPWLSIAGVALAVAAAGLSTQADRRADSSTAVFVLAYFGIIMLSRRAALLWIAASLGVWALVAPAAGIPVRVGDTDLNLRWFTLGQLGISALFLWWVWYREIERAAERDRRALLREQDRLDAIQMQERVRVARETLVRTHETVLNDIRYVLTTERPDRARLAEQLALRQGELSIAPTSATVGTVASSIADGEGLGQSLHVTGGQVVLDRRQAEVLDSALREVVRNATRHAGASALHIAAEQLGSVVSVRVRHNGRPSGGATGTGIGTALVIDESLASIGGSVVPHPDGVDLHVPQAEHAVDDDETGVSDLGRIALSAVTAGNTIGGLPYAAALALGVRSLAAVTIAGNVVLATLIGASAASRRRVRLAWTLACTIAATAATLVAASLGRGCEWTEVAAILATLCGFAVTSAAVWAPIKGWWALGIPWAGAVLWFTSSIPGTCTGTTKASLRAAALPLALLALISWSQHRTTRLARREQLLRRRQAAEVAAAAAALDMSQRLQQSVERATTIMLGVANGDELGEAERTALRCLDASIRAAIQVQPGLAGGISMAALALTRAASAVGVPVRVLLLRDSGDARPVAAEVVELAQRLLEASSEGTAVLQVVTAPYEDLLIVTTTVAAARRARMTEPLSRLVGPDEFSFDGVDGDESDDEVAVAFVRRVSAPPRGWSPPR